MEQMPIIGDKERGKGGADTLYETVEPMRGRIQTAERNDSEALERIRGMGDTPESAMLYEQHRARVTAAADSARTAVKTLEENPADVAVNMVAVEDAIKKLLHAMEQIQPDAEKPVSESNVKRYV